MRRALYTLLIALCAPAAWAGPFGSAVVNYNPGPGFFSYTGSPYTIADKCLGAPLSGVELYEPALGHPASTLQDPCNATVITLGDRRKATGRGTVTIGFDSPVTDNPRNPYGLDFIVFSNAQFIGGMADQRWQEPAFVEISPDGANWYLIKTNKWPSELVKSRVVDNVFIPGDTGTSSTILRGYAECTPTLDLPQYGGYPVFSANRTPEELFTVPDRPSLPTAYGALDLDLVTGGGDAFDIADAVLELQTDPGVPVLANGQTIPAGISSFNYIRLTDAVEGDSEPGLGEISAEIEAVAAVRPAITLGESKKLPEGGYALVTEAVVTAVFPTCFFVESPDRSSALRVEWNSWANIARSTWRTITPGDKLTLTGHISRANGRFTLPDPMFTVTSEANDLPAPLGMPLKSLASNLAYGLRVRTWGRVTDAGDGSYCIISDGSQSARVVSEDYSISVDQGSFITLTGICDRDEDGTTQIRLPDPSDISTPEQ